MTNDALRGNLAAMMSSPSPDHVPQSGDPIPILIVSYRTPGDVLECLASLDALHTSPPTAIYICENGGLLAWETLCHTLLAPNGCCVHGNAAAPEGASRLSNIACLALVGSGRAVFIGQAVGNLGYAGGLNAWLAPLMRNASWPGCWILNPDTIAFPDSLVELLRKAESDRLGVTASRLADRIVDPEHNIVGLRWQALLARTKAVVVKAESRHAIQAIAGRRHITAPSGASVYMTRETLRDIAPLDERYFLFYEDLDWGVRATRAGHGVGYAFNSVVTHKGGGSTGTKSVGYGSRLSVYLQFRNRLVFVHTHYPGWFIYTSLFSILHALRAARQGAFAPAVEGIAAGLREETGRPDWLVRDHVMPRESGSTHARMHEAIGN